MKQYELYDSIWERDHKKISKKKVRISPMCLYFIVASEVYTTHLDYVNLKNEMKLFNYYF